MKYYMDFASSIKSTLVWIINIPIVIKSSGIYERVQSITPVKEFFLIELSQNTFLFPFIRLFFVLWVNGCNIRSSNVWDKEIKHFTGPIISTVCYKRSLTIITESFFCMYPNRLGKCGQMATPRSRCWHQRFHKTILRFSIMLQEPLG